MKSMWYDETGKLQCMWSNVGRSARYAAPWMAEEQASHGSYLEPVPDFASHSPFGGPEWFELHGWRRKHT